MKGITNKILLMISLSCFLVYFDSVTIPNVYAASSTQTKTAEQIAAEKVAKAKAKKEAAKTVKDHPAGYIPFLGKKAPNSEKPYQIMNPKNSNAANDKKAKESTFKKIAGADEFGVDAAGVNQFRDSAEKIARIITALVFGFSVIMICLAGFKFAMSEGEPRKLREAKMQIITAGIGIGIGLLTLIIVKVFKEIIMFQHK